MEAIAWLGTDTVLAAFKETGPAPAIVPSRVADAQAISSSKIADDPKVAGRSGYGN
jgi:hypothetical protein